MVSTCVIHGREYLAIVDEPQIVRVFKETETDLIMYKEFYVSDTFASLDSSSINKQLRCVLVDDAIYSKDGGQIIMEAGTEVHDMF